MGQKYHPEAQEWAWGKKRWDEDRGGSSSWASLLSLQTNVLATAIYCTSSHP